MSHPDKALDTIVENWTNQLPPITGIAYLGNAGGFSGADFWRLQAGSDTYCLRRWPQEYPSPKRLAWIHSVLGFVAQRQQLPLALPIPTQAGETFLMVNQHLWELTPWLPGEPVDFTRGSTSESSRPEPEIHHCIRKGMQALAQFHLASAECPYPEDGIQGSKLSTGVSPGLVRRRDWTVQLLRKDDFANMESALRNDSSWPTLVPLALSLLNKAKLYAPQCYKLIYPHVGQEVPLQPVIRDSRCDHLLFTGGELTGWIDFGSMRTDTRVGDIIRLLVGMADDCEVRWQQGMQAYEALLPLSDAERTLLPLFEATQVLFSATNWIKWLYLEKRTFERMAQVEQRLHQIDRQLSQRLRGDL